MTNKDILCFAFGLLLVMLKRILPANPGINIGTILLHEEEFAVHQIVETHPHGFAGKDHCWATR